MSSASFLMIVNETPIDFFQSSKGLRQGDPLSSYLFVLAMEALSQLIVKAKEGGFISGFSIGKRSSGLVEVTHLLYVDNTIIFCETNVEQLRYLNWTLMWFEVIFGLKVNMEKSELISLGRIYNPDKLVAILGCRVGCLPSSYFIILLRASFKLLLCGKRWRREFRKDQLYEKDRIYQKGGDSLSLKAPCLAYLSFSVLVRSSREKTSPSELG